MKKKLSRILSAILVLCMLPATFITAFARDKGVFYDEVENQSIENAKGQYIPETITIDGKLNDTGWPESNFNYVDVNTGYWSVLEPAHSGLNYKYQIRADHSQFYLGASVALPEGISSATFTLLLKDSDKTETSGYTHRLVVALENGTARVKEHDNITLSISADNHPVLAAEKHLIACESDGQNYTFELRNLLCDMGISDISKITYYVSVDVANGDKTESLYHPKYALDYGIKTPTFDYWPVDSDGNVGGIAVNTTYGNEVDDLPYEVTVDGRFDEAVWASLTDFHLNGKEDPYGSKNEPEIANIDSSKYFTKAVTYELNAKHTAVEHSAYNTADGYDTIRFKYEIRVDKDYLYGAVVAYIPEFESYKGTYYYNGESKGTYTVMPAPDLYIYFFGDNNGENGYPADNANIIAENGKHQVDGVIQIRSSDRSSEANDNKEVVYAYNKMCVEYDIDNTSTRIAGWKNHSAACLQATRLELAGNIWHFEFRVKADELPTDENGDIVYGVGLADRTQFSVNANTSASYMELESGFEGVNVNRSFAWTGGGSSATYRDRKYYDYNSQKSAGNIFTKEQLENAKESSLTVAHDKMFDDNMLSQELWAALTAADYIVDSNARGTVDYNNYLLTQNGNNSTIVNSNYNDLQRANGAIGFSQGGRFMYKLTADYEYLYGAAYIKLYGGKRFDYNNTSLDGTETREFRVYINTSQKATDNGHTVIKVPLDPSKNAFGSNNERVTAIVKEIPVESGSSTQYYYAIEFKVPMSDLGVSYSLDANDEDLLFSYYTSVCTITSDTTKGFTTYEFDMVHPKANSVGGDYFDFSFYPSWSWQLDGDAHFTYGNMLKDITVDGQLDENYWIGDEKETVEMIHVDGTNGTYQNESEQGNSLSFDYKIYAGENYIYGAAIIEGAAVATDTPYEHLYWNDYSSKPMTRFELWIDNKQNEYPWDRDNQAGNADGKKMEKSQTQVYYGTDCFENYYYNFYLSNNSSNGSLKESTCGLYTVGGCTPNWYYNGKDGSSDKVEINEKNFAQAVTTINGKTYVEFIINLDNFHCDRSLGFNYYVSATQYYENEETAEENGGETLTLYYSEIKTESYDFWVTHYNPTNNLDGMGAIFDSTSVANDFFKYGWWEKAIFTKVTGKTDTYRLDYIVHGGNASENFGSVSSLEAGQFAYAVHTGDYHYDEEAGEYKGYDIPEAKAMYRLLNASTVGKEFVIKGINLGALNTTIGKDIKSSGNGEIIAQAWHDTPTDGVEAVTWHDKEYRCSFSITPVDELTVDTTAYSANMPTETAWDSANDGTIKKLSHFAPDVVKVDGNLTESVWGNKDGWIEVQDDINGTFQEPDVSEKGKGYRFKLMNDGEYLYVAAEIDVPYNDSFAPSFRIWIQSDNAEKTGEGNEIISYTNFYRITYGNSNVEESTKAIAALPTPSYNSPAEDFEYTGYREGIVVATNGTEGTVVYENLLAFGKNKSNTIPKGTSEEFLDKGAKYGETAFYGYTEEIQENQDRSGNYYPDIQTTKTYIGKESAMMKPSADNSKTWVEFKVALEEFGGIGFDENGDAHYNDFEYFIQATWHIDSEQNTVFYPLIYTESRSDSSYYNNNFPVWKWFGNNAASITAEDMQSGAMRMRNNCMPVVTLGAKICEDYLCPDSNILEPAIRFGALYTEDYLRNHAENDANDPLDTSDDMYTAKINDYWDIHEVGIAVLPTQMLENEGEVLDLTLETPAIFTAPADNIVNWKDGNEVDGGWSNFADYENFVYYITLWGLSEEMKDVKFSFVPYVDFYASAGTETYYGETFVRSYNMIKEYTLSENGFEDDNSTPVLPDSDYSDYPPAENHPQESSVVIEDNSESNE
ncbi:MAG: hypothetical protein IKM32_05060 [Clostridia bacterium]|nr:hypothetical protein [Clostridia bacterium]